jgi:uncharacterized protein
MWRTTSGKEVDFVLYGDDGFVSIEVKRSRTVTPKDLSGLKTFRADYPSAKSVLLYGGDQDLQIDGVRVLPFGKALTSLDELL